MNPVSLTIFVHIRTQAGDAAILADGDEAMGRSTATLASGTPARAGCPSRGRPIDLVHLTRQTLGDQALENELLGLMNRQIEAFSSRIDLATEDERRHIAHALKGAARNIGAFALADAAEAVEHAPGEKACRESLGAEMVRTSAFITSLNGG